MPRETASATRATRSRLVAAVTLAGSAASCGLIPPVRHAIFDGLWDARGYALLAAWSAFIATVITLVATRFASKTNVRTGIAVGAGALDIVSMIALAGLSLQPGSLIAGTVISSSFVFTCLALSTATHAAKNRVAIPTAAWTAIADPARAVSAYLARKFDLRRITSTKVLRAVGSVLLVAITMFSSATIAGAIQVFGHVTGLHKSAAAAAASPSVPTTVTMAPTTTTTDPKPKVLHCVGNFGDASGTVPQTLRDLARSAGHFALDRYRACPLGPLHLRSDDLYEQPAYTNDSDRARIVAWIDNLGRPHATFVTSDQANAYRRIDPAIDWRQLGLPLPAVACGGPAVQPLVDLDGKLIAVGVERRLDEIGTWEEPIYVPAAILGEWLARSESNGTVGVPAGRAKSHDGGLRQWVLDWPTPIDAPTTTSRTFELAQLMQLCR